jgi:hypothetical protein
MPGGLEGPVNFSWSAAILTGATFNPLTTFDFETPDRDVAVEVLHRATAVGLVAVIKSGGQAISQESPVQAGGTAGTLPARQTTEPMTGKGFASRKLQVFYRNPTGGTITVDGIAIVTPLGGGGRGGARRSSPRGGGGRFRRRR